MAWIQVIPVEEADGDLLEAYRLLGVEAGSAPPYEVLTNNGPAMLRHVQFSQTIRFGPSPVTRLQREMIATYVSALNGCVF
jgi:alkylhydroperoxidase family enzyme